MTYEMGALCGWVDTERTEISEEDTGGMVIAGHRNFKTIDDNRTAEAAQGSLKFRLSKR